MELIVMLLIGGFIYFIPTWIGWNHRNCDSIIAINIFLGWTFVGWVVALAMSLSSDRQIVQPPVQENKIDKLIKIKALFDSGGLTEVEYNIEKQKILNS